MNLNIDYGIKHLLRIHIFSSDDWHQVKLQWLNNFAQSGTCQKYSRTKAKYFTTCYWGDGVLKVKMKSILHIYILPLFY